VQAGQFVGAASMIVGCGTGNVILCSAGWSLYMYSSIYEIAILDDTMCERVVSGITSSLGVLYKAQGAWQPILAVMDGTFDAAICPTLQPPPAYASPDLGTTSADPTNSKE
jgi:hypothetical protein